MAIVRKNNFLKGARGLVGDNMVFKSWNGKTYLFSKAQPAKKQSQKQKENRSRFKEATLFAKSMMSDPQKKAEYKRIAKRLKLPNAYTAAITEYMRRPEIKHIDIARNISGGRQEVKADVRKKDFDIESVEISIFEKGEKLVEHGKMTKGGIISWKYYTNLNIYDRQDLQVLIRATDKTGNVVEIRKPV
jgi:hypothetical protein